MKCFEIMFSISRWRAVTSRGRLESSFDCCLSREFFWLIFDYFLPQFRENETSTATHNFNDSTNDFAGSIKCERNKQRETQTAVEHETLCEIIQKPASRMSHGTAQIKINLRYSDFSITSFLKCFDIFFFLSLPLETAVWGEVLLWNSKLALTHRE